MYAERSLSRFIRIYRHDVAAVQALETFRSIELNTKAIRGPGHTEHRSGSTS
jgi:hypothetical protein